VQESIIQYSGGIYEEMEVFDDEFYIEPSPENEEFSRKNYQKTGQAPCSVTSVSN